MKRRRKDIPNLFKHVVNTWAGYIFSHQIFEIGLKYRYLDENTVHSSRYQDHLSKEEKKQRLISNSYKYKLENSSHFQVKGLKKRSQILNHPMAYILLLTLNKLYFNTESKSKITPYV